MSTNAQGHEDFRPSVDPENSIELIRTPRTDAGPEIHTVHLVDHDSDTLLSFFDALSNAGFQVSASSNTIDALSYIARIRPELLVAEMDMAEMNGVELSQRVREISPTTRILLTSATALRAAYQDILRQIEAGHLLKPLTAGQLVRAVERAFR